LLLAAYHEERLKFGISQMVACPQPAWDFFMIICLLQRIARFFAPFVHPKLPFGARPGLGWGARPSTVNFVGDEVTSL